MTLSAKIGPAHSALHPLKAKCSFNDRLLSCFGVNPINLECPSCFNDFGTGIVRQWCCQCMLGVLWLSADTLMMQLPVF
uniref:Uncharacterized protein n=1 Tax=Anguilla anguilla TaxID=7936 RepID=A0A0E9W6Y8_ANGAN